MVVLRKGTISDDKFLLSELKQGVKIEREHTFDKELAKQIAKAHLVENPFYYTYLYHMEREMEKNLTKDLARFKYMKTKKANNMELKR